MLCLQGGGEFLWVGLFKAASAPHPRPKNQNKLKASPKSSKRCDPVGLLQSTKTQNLENIKNTESPTPIGPRNRKYKKNRKHTKMAIFGLFCIFYCYFFLVFSGRARVESFAFFSVFFVPRVFGILGFLCSVALPQGRKANNTKHVAKSGPLQTGTIALSMGEDVWIWSTPPPKRPVP